MLARSRLAISLLVLVVAGVLLSACGSHTTTTTTTLAPPAAGTRPTFHNVPAGLQRALISYFSHKPYTATFPGEVTFSARPDPFHPLWWRYDGDGKGKYARELGPVTGIAERSGSRWFILSGPGNRGCVSLSVPSFVASYFGLKFC